MLPLVSHDEYADETDGQTDGRQTVTIRFLLDAANVTSWYSVIMTYFLAAAIL